MPTSAIPGKVQPVVAFGPEMPGWGSWDWVGADLRDESATFYETLTFGATDLPSCDVLVIVKHLPPREAIERAAMRSAVLYLPVDYYGAGAEIDADGGILRKSARV